MIDQAFAQNKEALKCQIKDNLFWNASATLVIYVLKTFAHEYYEDCRVVTEMLDTGFDSLLLTCSCFIN